MTGAVRRRSGQAELLEERLPDLHTVIAVEQRPAAALSRLGPGLAFAARRKDTDQQRQGWNFVTSG